MTLTPTEEVDLVTSQVVWRSTGAPVFDHAARVDGAWWVLRRNGFPDHPLFTLFVDGTAVGDVEDLRTQAPAWDLDVTARPTLPSSQRDEILTTMRGLGPYGSEQGHPCAGDWCPCSRLTDEFIRERATRTG